MIPPVLCSVPALAAPADVGRARGWLMALAVTAQKCTVPFPSFSILSAHTLA